MKILFFWVDLIGLRKDRLGGVRFSELGWHSEFSKTGRVSSSERQVINQTLNY